MVLRTHVARSAAVVAAAALAATALTSCSGSASQPIGGKATGTVQFWTRSGVDTWTKAVVADFNKSHKDLQVKLTDVEDANIVTKLSTVLRTNDVPDVVATDDVDSLPFINSNLFLDITKQIKSAGLDKTLSPAQLDLATIKGKYYGTPAVSDLSVLVYNKRLFKQAGIAEPPTTLAEVLADAKKIRALGPNVYGLTIPGNCPGCLTFAGLPSVYAAKSDVFSGGLNDQKATVADNAALEQTLEFYRDIWNSGVTPKSDRSDDGSSWGANFQKGNIGMAPGGLFIQASTPAKLKSDIAVAPLPGPTGGVSTYVGGADFGIPAKAKNAAGAWEFIKFALSDKSQRLAAETGYSPVLTTLWNDSAFLKQYPSLAAGLEAAKTGNAPKTLYHNQIFSQNSGPWLTMFRGVVYNGQDPKKALQTAQQGFTSVLSGNQ